MEKKIDVEDLVEVNAEMKKHTKPNDCFQTENGAVGEKFSGNNFEIWPALAQSACIVV